MTDCLVNQSDYLTPKANTARTDNALASRHKVHLAMIGVMYLWQGRAIRFRIYTNYYIV